MPSCAAAAATIPSYSSVMLRFDYVGTRRNLADAAALAVATPEPSPHWADRVRHSQRPVGISARDRRLVHEVYDGVRC